MADTKAPQQYSFEAEVKELLDLMIHAIYSNKDIFLRELISNSSDAIDKIKFQSLTKGGLLAEGYEPQILIERDMDKRTLTIRDNGIGMTEDEVKSLIGTIAKSGTREFAQLIKQQGKDDELSPELIGQFGVGFYSSFIAADNVVLETKKAGQKDIVRWESTGDGTYTLEKLSDKESTLDNHGTAITLQLKTADEEDGMKDYTDEWVIRQIVKRYSDFVAYPIQMDISRTEVERDENGQPKEGAEPVTTVERETLNSMKAIWTRPQNEVTQEEYNEFYKHISHDWEEPLKTLKFKIEGTFEANVLLFLPSKAPMDLFHREYQRGIQLYVKRVFIMDDCETLVPQYLRFVRGVVDSEDLSLNISREILQQDRQIQAIKKRLVKKVLNTLEDLQSQNTEEYASFWEQFGKALKEGIYEDAANKDTILSLGLFHSTHETGKLTTLKEYVSRMKPEQDKIYYITGESLDTLRQSPHLEAFEEKGYEVLLLTDPIDEVWTQAVYNFEEKQLQSVGKGTVELGNEEEKKETEKQLEEQSKTYNSLLEKLKDSLSEHVKEVRLSSRLKNSASCLVGNTHDMTPQLEKLMRQMNQEVPENKRILELNPNHSLIQVLQGLYEKNQDDSRINDYGYLLYGQALLAEGSQVPEPSKFSRLVADLMTTTLKDA